MTQDESADRVVWETEAYDLLPKPTTGTASAMYEFALLLPYINQTDCSQTTTPYRDNEYSGFGWKNLRAKRRRGQSEDDDVPFATSTFLAPGDGSQPLNSSAIDSTLSTNDHNKENVDILSQESITAKEQPLELPPTPPLDLQQAIKHSQPSIAVSTEPVRCTTPSFPSSSSAAVLTSPTTPPFPLTHPPLPTQYQSNSAPQQQHQQHHHVLVEAPSQPLLPQSTRIIPVNSNDHRPPLPPSASVFPQMPPPMPPQPQPALSFHHNSSSHGMRPVVPVSYTASMPLAPVHQPSVQAPISTGVVSSTVVMSHEDIEISDEDLARIDAEIEAVCEFDPLCCPG